jgi:hypothetical protein
MAVVLVVLLGTFRTLKTADAGEPGLHPQF